jgi:hypothetical protein
MATSNMRIWSAAILIMCATAAHSITLNVNCGQKAGLASIGAALKLLQNPLLAGGPNIINVTGNCTEDVVIQGMDHLTLNGMNGASISDPSQGANVTLVIDDSRDVVVNNFVISGYAAGDSGQDVVDCQDGSVCRFNGNTVQNSPQGGGLGVWVGSYAAIKGGSLQNNTSWAGLVVANGGTALANGVSVQGNAVGVQVDHRGFLEFQNSTITGNASQGILVRDGSMVRCVPCTVSGNVADGIHAEQSSTVEMQSGATGFSVSGNGGMGISLSNLSSVTFRGNGTVTTTGALKVACNPSYTTAANLSNAGVVQTDPTQTNCAGP